MARISLNYSPPRLQDTKKIENKGLFSLGLFSKKRLEYKVFYDVTYYQ